jgi:hypothetical protein
MTARQMSTGVLGRAHARAPIAWHRRGTDNSAPLSVQRGPIVSALLRPPRKPLSQDITFECDGVAWDKTICSPMLRLPVGELAASGVFRRTERPSVMHRHAGRWRMRMSEGFQGLAQHATLRATIGTSITRLSSPTRMMIVSFVIETRILTDRSTWVLLSEPP